MAVWRHEAGKLAPRLGRKTVRIGIGHKLTRKEREGEEEGEEEEARWPVNAQSAYRLCTVPFSANCERSLRSVAAFPPSPRRLWPVRPGSSTRGHVARMASVTFSFFSSHSLSSSLLLLLLPLPPLLFSSLSFSIARGLAASPFFFARFVRRSGWFAHRRRQRLLFDPFPLSFSSDGEEEKFAIGSVLNSFPFDSMKG